MTTAIPDIMSVSPERRKTVALELMKRIIATMEAKTGVKVKVTTAKNGDTIFRVPR